MRTGMKMSHEVVASAFVPGSGVRPSRDAAQGLVSTSKLVSVGQAPASSTTRVAPLGTATG